MIGTIIVPLTVVYNRPSTALAAFIQCAAFGVILCFLWRDMKNESVVIRTVMALVAFACLSIAICGAVAMFTGMIPPMTLGAQQ